MISSTLYGIQLSTTSFRNSDGKHRMNVPETNNMKETQVFDINRELIKPLLDSDQYQLPLVFSRQFETAWQLVKRSLEGETAHVTDPKRSAGLDPRVLEIISRLNNQLSESEKLALLSMSDDEAKRLATSMTKKLAGRWHLAKLLPILSKRSSSVDTQGR